MSSLPGFMQIKLLKEVTTFIAGAAASAVVDLLYGKKNVNEFLIAKKLKLNINQTRNILYKLAERGLISFIRKKDRKNGGWYTYYWTLDIGKSLDVLKNSLTQELTSFQSQLAARKNDRFYVCKNCDSEMTEEQALLGNFTCPECGEVLELRDNTELVTQLEASIERHKTHLAALGGELAIVHQKEESVRLRKKKAELKKKKVERERKKKENAKLKKAEDKKTKSSKKPSRAKSRGSRA